MKSFWRGARRGAVLIGISGGFMGAIILACHYWYGAAAFLAFVCLGSMWMRKILEERHIW